MFTRIGLAVLCLLLLAGSAGAATITLSGFLDDSTNAALIASDGYQDFQAARFATDDEVVRNVAMYTFTVTTGGTFSFDSFGWALGGAEPYFSLFEGAGASATFLDSNVFDPSIDFSLSRALVAGDYMLALGVWSNMSFAENNPDADPTLDDAFTALGDPSRLGSANYELRISSDDGVGSADPGGIRFRPGPHASAGTLGAAAAGHRSRRPDLVSAEARELHRLRV